MHGTKSHPRSKSRNRSSPTCPQSFESLQTAPPDVTQSEGPATEEGEARESTCLPKTESLWSSATRSILCSCGIPGDQSRISIKSHRHSAKRAIPENRGRMQRATGLAQLTRQNTFGFSEFALRASTQSPKYCISLVLLLSTSNTKMSTATFLKMWSLCTTRAHTAVSTHVIFIHGGGGAGSHL